jgi:hypothetical protein
MAKESNMPNEYDKKNESGRKDEKSLVGPTAPKSQGGHKEPDRESSTPREEQGGRSSQQSPGVGSQPNPGPSTDESEDE